MRQVSIEARRRQRRCRCCHELFQPDPRIKAKQQYCSQTSCQSTRQRANEKSWRSRNPDCLAYQQEQSRLWHKAHPDYSRHRRNNDPILEQTNREQTRVRMRQLRGKKLFDKSKSILTKITGTTTDNWYLTQGSRWLLMRLTNASLWSKSASLSDNSRRFTRVANRLPRGRLYRFSGLF